MVVRAPPINIQELRAQVRLRAFLVGLRTQLKNSIHAEFAKRGMALSVPPFTLRHGLTLSLRAESLDRLLRVIDALNQ